MLAGRSPDLQSESTPPSGCYDLDTQHPLSFVIVTCLIDCILFIFLFSIIYLFYYYLSVVMQCSATFRAQQDYIAA